MSSAAEFHGVPFISFWLTMLSGHCSECPHLYLLVETFFSNRFWVSSLKLRSCIHFYFGLLLEVKGKDAASFSDMQLLVEDAIYSDMYFGPLYQNSHGCKSMEFYLGPQFCSIDQRVYFKDTII